MSLTKYVYNYLSGLGYTGIEVNPDCFSTTADVSALSPEGVPCSFRAAFTLQQNKRYVVLSKV